MANLHYLACLIAVLPVLVSSEFRLTASSEELDLVGKPPLVVRCFYSPTSDSEWASINSMQIIRIPATGGGPQRVATLSADGPRAEEGAGFEATGEITSTVEGTYLQVTKAEPSAADLARYRCSVAGNNVYNEYEVGNTDILTLKEDFLPVAQQEISAAKEELEQGFKDADGELKGLVEEVIALQGSLPELEEPDTAAQADVLNAALGQIRQEVQAQAVADAVAVVEDVNCAERTTCDVPEF